MGTMRLQGKVSVVTGGASGIGRQTALTLAKEGSIVAVVDIKRKEGEETAKEIGGGFFYCDLVEISGIADVFNQIIRRYGSVDVLVNCAGLANRTPIEDISEEEWDLLNNVNLKAAFFASKEACRIMKARGTAGKIVNMSSIRGLQADGRHTIYDVTKAGLLAMTRSFAVAYAKDGIKVNAVCPGYVLTPMTAHNLDRKDWYAWICDRIPVGRLTEMQEVADAVLFLASDEARGITGQQIVVDGGWTVHD